MSAGMPRSSEISFSYRICSVVNAVPKSTGTRSEHVTPCGGKQRAPQSSLTSGSQVWRTDAGDDEDGHVTHMLAEIGNALPHSSLDRVSLRIVGTTLRPSGVT
jgi:hypothetical protein